MSKFEDIGSALSKANAALAVVYQTVKRGGNPRELRLVEEAMDALVNVLFESAGIEAWAVARCEKVHSDGPEPDGLVERVERIIDILQDSRFRGHGARIEDASEALQELRRRLIAGEATGEDRL